MFKRLIRFANGQFGVRYGLFFHKFQDFRHTCYRWPQQSRFFRDCMTTEEEARTFFKHEVIE